MALVVADRIKETTTTTGTGTYTLGGASTGFEAFSVIGNSNTTYYCCTDGTDFEIGIGTYTASGTTLARTTILQSSNGDDKVNWGSGTRDIFVTQPAEKAVFRDASGHIIALDGRNLTNVDAATLDSIDSGSFLRSDAADTKTSGNLEFSDNVRLRLGSGGDADLQIWHDGTNSNIVNGTGDLIIGDTSGVVKIQGKYGEQSIVANNDGAVELYYNNGKRIETTSTGANIEGDLTVDLGGGSVEHKFTSWSSSNTDIDGLIAGSNFGALYQVRDSGHLVIGLQENDSNDSVNIISGGGNYTTDNTYDTLIARFKANGDTHLNKIIATELDISGNVDVDGTLEADAITLNGTALASSATTDTTNASNISSGTLNANRLPDLTVSELAANSLTTSAESFADNDTTLMTSAAINDRIESFGYSTTTGTVTSVGTTGTVNGITLTGTVTSSGNLTLGGTLGSITVSQLAGSALTTSSESFADNDTTLMTSAAINDRIESFGYTTNTGDITGVTAGTGLSGGGDSGSVTLAVDLSELTDMTQDIVGTDEFIVLDNGADRRKAANEIPLSIFDNDSGFITASSTDTLTNKTINASQLSGTVANARLDQQLQDVAGLATTDGGFIVGNGSNFQLESGSTVRTSLGLGSAATRNVGISANNVAQFTSGVADNDFLKISGTDVEGRSASEVLSDIGGISASSTDTLTNKTLTTPVINGFSGTGDGSITGNLTITSTDGGATENPTLDLYRNSASPADQDVLGNISFSGEDSAGNKTIYAKINSDIIDQTDGTEDGRLDFNVVTGGVLQNRLILKGNGVTAFINKDVQIGSGIALRFEGSTEDANETTLTVVDPTADRTVTLPNASGTVLTTGNSDTPTTTTSSSDADFVLVDDGGTMKKITPANLGITSGSASKGFAVAMAIAL